MAIEKGLYQAPLGLEDEADQQGVTPLEFEIEGLTDSESPEEDVAEGGEGEGKEELEGFAHHRRNSVDVTDWISGGEARAGTGEHADHHALVVGRLRAGEGGGRARRAAPGRRRTRRTRAARRPRRRSPCTVCARRSR